MRRLGLCFPSRRGFVLHTVTRLHWPRVLSTTRGSATLCSLPVQGSPFPGRFYGARGNFVLQSSSASRGKAHHLLVSRPASACFGLWSDIGTRSAVSARPPPHTHIAGSLFATYTSSASCFLRTSHLWKCPCLVGVVLPSDHGATSPAACVPCPAHTSTQRVALGWYGNAPLGLKDT
jgi:hypothetical protein